MTNEEIIEILQTEYKDIKNSKEIQDLIKILSSSKGSYLDLYEMVDLIGGTLGEKLKSFLEFVDTKEVGAFVPVLEQYFNDINDAGVILQTTQNATEGINLKGQSIIFDRKDAKYTLQDIIFTNTARDTIVHYGFKTVDQIVEKNADFLSKTGYSQVLIRKYDNVGLHRRTKWANSCSWCLERVGTVEYSSMIDRKYFERHKGCNCSIDIKSGSSKTKVENYYKKKIDVKDDPAEYKATIPNLNRNINNDIHGMRQDLAKFGGLSMEQTQAMTIPEIRKAYSDFKAKEISKKKDVYDKIRQTMERKKDFLRKQGIDPSKMSYSAINSEYTKRNNKG